jgi:tetratricopeptide (TPR) repeat protein
MSSKQPIFLLRVAKGLIEDVKHETDALLKAIRELEEEVDYSKVSYVAADLIKDSTIALQLIDRAVKLDPEIALPDGTTPSSLKSLAYFELGLINVAQRKFKEAIKYFEESLRYEPDQATYYNIGVCYLRMKGLFTDKTQEAISALQKCIDMDPETSTAVDAGKVLARRGLL